MISEIGRSHLAKFELPVMPRECDRKNLSAPGTGQMALWLFQFLPRSADVGHFDYDKNEMPFLTATVVCSDHGLLDILTHLTCMVGLYMCGMWKRLPQDK